MEKNRGMEALIEQLTKPMSDNEIEWKVQTVVQGQQGLRALVVPYLEARAVHHRLDTVFPLRWKSEYRVVEGFTNRVAIECTLSVYNGEEWISRTDAAEATNIEAVKGGYSDAMKRAAVQFGIGRFLYEVPQQWVEIYEQRPQGNSEYINSRYKVSGREMVVKGYYIRPSIEKIIPFPQTQRQQGNNMQNQGKNSNNDNRAIYQNVTSCLQELNLQIQHVPKLFETAVGQQKTLDIATSEELQQLFNMLYPVKMLLQIGEHQFKKSKEEMFMYASHLLNKQVNRISDLFFTLDKEKLNAIFNQIRSEIKGQNQFEAKRA